jgi:uroporphyrin-III C-methyltransferase
LESPCSSGISSSIAVPASQGISLTKEAFQKVLGDYGNHFGKKLSTDALAAQSTATVILMGMSKLDQIALFQKSRKAKCLWLLFKTNNSSRESRNWHKYYSISCCS